MKADKFAVIGIGHFGRAIALSLARNGAEVMAIDTNYERIDQISDEVSYAVNLDATDKRALLSQDIRSFDVVIVIQNIKFDAFFWNVTFHEVAHGLGIKNTVTGKGAVREALQVQYSNWEEAKADILGLYMVQKLIEKGEITNITVEEAYTTFIAGLFRSVRFGRWCFQR